MFVNCDVLQAITLFVTLWYGNVSGISPDLCYSESLKSCTVDGHECGNLGGLQDINGNYYSNPLCDTGFNGGGCVCDNVAGYNYYTCLPDLNGCTMCNLTPQLIDLDTSTIKLPGYIAYNNGGYSMYYCFNQDNEYSTFTNEIRVVAAHAQATDALVVNLRTCSGIDDLTKPIKLLLTSYNENHWLIQSDDQYVIENINIIDIQLWSYYDTLSSVTIDPSLSRIANAVTPQIRYASSSNLGLGYGSDSGGGSSAKLLSNVPDELGDYAYSFVGQYETDTIEACVGNQGVIDPFDIFESSTMPTTTDNNAQSGTTESVTTESVITSIISPDLCYSESLKSCTVDGHECGNLGGLQDINGNYYSNPLCDTGFNGGGCVCDNVDGYNYYTCLPDLNGCTMCNASPQLSELDESPPTYPGLIAYDNGGYSMYYCINQEHDYSTFTNEVRVVGAYESSNGDTRNHVPGAATINLRTCSGIQDLEIPIILLLTSYEPIDWIIKSDDPYVIANINIIDIQVWSYYSSQSSVTMDPSLSHITVIPQIKYASTLGFGFGNDDGGGSTGKMLDNIPSQFGDYAYSFVGQYTIDTVEACVGDQGDIISFAFEETATPTTTTETSETTTESGTTNADTTDSETPTNGDVTKPPRQSTSTQSGSTTKGTGTTDVNDCRGCDDEASSQRVEGCKILGILFVLFFAIII